jgi:signal transduction histidine kinase
MAETTITGNLQLILASMVGMFGLALGLVVFVLIYQRKFYRQRQEQLAREADYQLQLMRANLISQEKERSRIGKDLHDSVGAMLTTARLYFRQINRNLDAEDFEALKRKAIDLMDQTLTSVRRVSHDLKPLVLEELGLTEAIGNLVSQINDAGTLQVDYQYNAEVEMDKEYEINWYRITQELMQNTLKHAHATRLRIRISVLPHQLIMHYEDDGVGMGQEGVINKGLGIKNIESRLGLMGGQIEYISKESQGLALRIQSKLNPDTQP